MTNDRFYLNCRITKVKEAFSGKVHTLVINHDQQEYYFDELFMTILENINNLENVESSISQFGCTSEEFNKAKELILEGKFVLAKTEIQPKRIGFLTERMSLGFGVDLVVHETAKRLQSDFGYDVTVFSGKVEEIYQNTSYKIISLDIELNIKDTFSQKYHTVALPYLNSHKIDLWLIETPPFYYWKDQLNAPIIFVEHGTPEGRFFPRKMRIIVETANWTKKYLIFENLRPFDHIISVSEYLKNDLPSHSRNRTTVIYNGSDHYPLARKDDIKRFKEVYNLKENDFILLSVGRIDLTSEKAPYKSFEELMEIFEEAKRINPSIKLIIAGRGEDRAEHILKSKGIIPVFNVPKDNLPIIYGACDLYVTASRWEGFNLPLAEAQFAGIPCIAYNLCAHPEVLKDKQTGFLVNSKEEFKAKILELADQKEILAELSQNSLEHAKSFSWLKSVSKLNDIVENILFEGKFKGDGIYKKTQFQFLRMYYRIAINILATEGLLGFSVIVFYELSKRLKYCFKD
ncbi:glycosyltransferase family 4 protein [bacterium]|nr:glycosyltransferase family 4 protein [bacterium]